MRLYLLWEMIIIMIMISYCSFFIHRYMKIYTTDRSSIIWEYLVISFIIVIIFFIQSHFLSYAMLFIQLLVFACILEVIHYWFKRYKYWRFLYTTGILLLFVTISLIVYNEYKMSKVVEKVYELTSDKIDDLKILQITDLHMSHLMSVDQIKKYSHTMNELDIDIIVLTGDIFEEKTTYEEVEQVAKILGSIKNELGIYYIFGNHDSFAFYDNRGYTSDDIRMAFEKNNITVLEDEVVTVNNITIIGRRDVGLGGKTERKDMNLLLKGVDVNNYIIVLDHQPLDIEENAKKGIDLELSGHTHGGEAYPLEYVESMLGKGIVYGRKTINNFTAITSSGISFSKRTGAPNEYVYIVIKNK